MTGALRSKIMFEQHTHTFTARWIFPVAAPPLERGTVTIAGDKIVAVEPHGTRRPDVDLGNVALLPGFVNAHTHLDLTGARGVCPPTPDFTQWLRHVIAFRGLRGPEEVQTDIATGLAECLRFGTTLIGDISAAGASWELIGHASCRAVVFCELLGLTNDRVDTAWAEVEAWSSKHEDRVQFRRGLSPHAPYSVHQALYDLVAQHWMPVATHLAETQAELELLRFHEGPFVDFLKQLKVWNPSGLAVHPTHIWLPTRAILVHCNYLDPATPFLQGKSVVVCPRTHAAFGHPHHPFPEMLKRGVRVALGTDSLASNPDLDILAEARFLHEHYPEVEPAMLLRMLTLSGAEALGFDTVTGSLTPGKSADLVVLPLPDDDKRDPHDLILESTLPVGRVLFRGKWVYGDAY
jgi:cytosine/adenosine deaminase-related metal-dependent hydrolase